MRRVRNALINVALATVSLLVVLAGSFGMDRLMGRVLPVAPLPLGAMQLIFPPGSEESFESCDFSYSVHINSLGLRDHELSLAKTDKYRILAIGDSFTYGWGVDIEESWPKQLEKDLQNLGLNVEVINLGKPGQGPSFYAAIAERAVPLLKPDLVVVGMLQDDFMDAAPEGARGRRAAFLGWLRGIYPNLTRLAARLGQSGGKSSEPAAKPETAYRHSVEENRRMSVEGAEMALKGFNAEQRARYEGLEEKIKSAFMSGNLNPCRVNLGVICPDYYRVVMDFGEAQLRDASVRTSDYMARIRDVARANGTRAVVASIPLGPYVNDDEQKNALRLGYKVDALMLSSDRPDMIARNAAAMDGMPFAEATGGFRERHAAQGLFFELDGHFSAAGHRLFAELITPQIAREMGSAAPRR